MRHAVAAEGATMMPRCHGACVSPKGLAEAGIAFKVRGEIMLVSARCVTGKLSPVPVT